MDFFQNYVDEICESVKNVNTILLDNAVRMMLEAHAQGGRVIFVGNGGSAAIASHVTVDLTKNSGLRAINFNEADLITCFANDYGYEQWVVKALEFYAQKGDVVVLISSSGSSPNIVNAADYCQKMGLKLITFSGFEPGNPLRTKGELNFWVNNSTYNVIEMTHHIWLLAIVDKAVMQIKSELTGIVDVENSERVSS